jgi:peptidoglycan/xylan/chitin deacetylase (PgdA/CDA1 family)
MYPFLLKKIFPSVIRNITTQEKILFLTFDDGPIPEVTPSVLDLLKQYNAKATFFCIGENVQKHSDVYNRIILEGHSTGNHTFNHLNGWKTKTKDYLENISRCDLALNSKQQTTNNKPLFRPPYGRITPSQYSILNTQYSIILWDVLSKDWEQNLSAEDCFQRVEKAAKPGSIIVFHDSLKAEKRMKPALEKTLDCFSEKGYVFKGLNDGGLTTSLRK